MTDEAQFPPTLELHCGPVAAIDLALFAAASGDHNPLHLDAEAARAAGFDRPVVHGMLTMAYAARLFSRVFGAGSVRALETRFTGLAKLGDTMILSATLASVAGDLGHYELRARTGAGAELVTGTAQVTTSRTSMEVRHR
jgi:acyl dehydratase